MRLVAAVSGALALTLGLATVVALRDATRPWRTHTNGSYGWTIRYPADWRFDSTTVRSRVTFQQWTFANFDAASGPARVRRQVVLSGTHEWPEVPDRLMRFPPSGVALRLAHRAGGPAPSYGQPESRFPLRMRDLLVRGGVVELSASGLVIALPGSASKALPLMRSARLAANGWTDFTVGTWVGPEASAEDREQLQRVLESLRFESLRTGQTTSSGFRVLGLEQDFPVGTVAGYRSARDSGPFARGFHLVRTPDGFRSLVDPLACALRFDVDTRTFGCPAVKTRWSLKGAQIGSPGQARLLTFPTRITSDGYVLVAFGGDVPLRRIYG